ncbi:MAG TPA: hypothetical protein DCS09_08505 [Porphyromonadaceae bacterium]|nr:hypothetical protein [Porphyromonadaceae bacterium]
MKHVKINCHGAMLIIPEWLRPLWPYQLPFNKWPSFCGAGDGIGDWLVPEKVHGVCISPACFIHDVDWALSPYSIREFLAANWRLFCNAKALIMISDLPWAKKQMAISRVAGLYLVAVSTIGTLYFEGILDGDEWDGIEISNPTVADRMRKLSRAALDI